MTIDEHNKLVDKGRLKKDGVYSYNGYLYAVKNNNFFAYADYSGNISSVHGVFHYSIGKCERYDRKKKLMELIKSI